MTQNALTPEQEAWLAALESGEYEQVQNALVSTDNGRMCFCCLGLAVKTVEPTHYSLETGEWDHRSSEEMGLPIDDFQSAYGGGDGSCAPEIFMRLHLLDDWGEFRGGAVRFGVTSLAEMNDAVGLSFAEIAAFIRKEPWVVFTNFDKPEAAQ
ncbi:MAG: hypothetical protein HRT64_15130 [Erythrobacter sp.]|nr:hypothetical protein [Erythrobacter sp.]